MEAVAVDEEGCHGEESEDNADESKEQDEERCDDVPLRRGEIDSFAVWAAVVDACEGEGLVLEVPTDAHVHGAHLFGLREERGNGRAY